MTVEIMVAGVSAEAPPRAKRAKKSPGFGRGLGFILTVSPMTGLPLTGPFT
jgi:hypothetical protein